MLNMYSSAQIAHHEVLSRAASYVPVIIFQSNVAIVCKSNITFLHLEEILQNNRVAMISCGCRPFVFVLSKHVEVVGAGGRIAVQL